MSELLVPEAARDPHGPLLPLQARVGFLVWTFLDILVPAPPLHPIPLRTTHSVHLIFVPSHTGPPESATAHSLGPHVGGLLQQVRLRLPAVRRGQRCPASGWHPHGPAPPRAVSDGAPVPGGSRLCTCLSSPILQVFIKCPPCTPPGTHCLAGETLLDRGIHGFLGGKGVGETTD